MEQLSKFNPWRIKNDSSSTINDVESRLRAVAKMTESELLTAYQFNGNQKTVDLAIERRLRKLNKSTQPPVNTSCWEMRIDHEVYVFANEQDAAAAATAMQRGAKIYSPANHDDLSGKVGIACIETHVRRIVISVSERRARKALLIK